MKLLDLTALDTPWAAEYFDPQLEETVGRQRFLKHFCRVISQAWVPGEETIGYLPTQCVADYLATVHEPPFDGVAYHSAQFPGGKNVTLFERALKVGTDDPRYPLPKSGVTLGRIGDDDDTSYCLHLHRGTDAGEMAEPPDLLVETAAITVHTVRKVKYASSVSSPIAYQLRRASDT